jgi:predicted metal-dependent phosphoesterase TrpH
MAGRVRVAIDPHVHSTDSYDAATPVEALLEAAVGAGLDGVVVTDHDAVRESRRAADLAADYGLIGIPGVEVSTADGHLLALGVREVPAPGQPLPATARAVRERGGVAVVPHPFQWWRHGVRAGAIADVDAIETYNAHTLFGVRNRQAARFAAREGLPGVAGSDAHSADLVGRAYTVVEAAARTPAAVVRAIGAGRTVARGGRTSPGQYLRKYARNAGLKAFSLV